jgi:hypothetical protein
MSDYRESHDGHYRVRIEGNWCVVPDDAIINKPPEGLGKNRADAAGLS